MWDSNLWPELKKIGVRGTLGVDGRFSRISGDTPGPTRTPFAYREPCYPHAKGCRSARLVGALLFWRLPSLLLLLLLLLPRRSLVKLFLLLLLLLSLPTDRVSQSQRGVDVLVSVGPRVALDLRIQLLLLRLHRYVLPLLCLALALLMLLLLALVGRLHLDSAAGDQCPE